MSTPAIQLPMHAAWTTNQEARAEGERDGIERIAALAELDGPLPPALSAEMEREATRAADARAIPNKWRRAYRMGFLRGANITVCALAMVEG